MTSELSLFKLIGLEMLLGQPSKAPVMAFDYIHMTHVYIVKGYGSLIGLDVQVGQPNVLEAPCVTSETSHCGWLRSPIDGVPVYLTRN